MAFECCDRMHIRRVATISVASLRAAQALAHGTDEAMNRMIPSKNHVTMSLFLLGITTIISLGSAQLIGDYQAEVHPPFSYEVCNESQCESVDAEIVLDAEWRWLHFAGNVNNCFEGGFGQGGDWVDACREAPSSGNEYCTTRCAIDGADYKGTYGIKTDGHTISMEYRTPQAFSTNLNSRVFLLEGVDRYQTFTLMNNELSFDVDVSDVPCGLNAALKLVQMDADGGQGRFENMKAGAKYGSGYCDAWCRRELRWPGEVRHAQVSQSVARGLS